MVQDFLFIDGFDKHLGWKHAAVNYSQIAKTSLCNETLFVFIIRNPYKFIHSLYRRPYQLEPSHIQKGNELSLIDFISHPVFPFAKDNLNSQCFLDSPVSLWNLKVDSYFSFEALNRVNTIIIKYEDLISHPERFFSKLEKHCSISANISLPHESTKKSDRETKDLDYYRMELATWNPNSALGSECVDLINSYLSLQTCNKALYKKVCPTKA